jgi:phosphate uptake regulator
MPEPYRRRVQLSGNSTLIVSLPKTWTERAGLKRLDEIILIPLDDRSLLIELENNRAKEAKVKIDSEDQPEVVIRELFSRYLSGFDRIILEFSTPVPQLAAEVKEKVRRWLIGVEVVEESAMYMEIQCLPMHTSLPLKRAVERMGGIASNMQVDAFSSMLTGDTVLASEVIARDDDVDRFYHFIIRQLNLAVANPMLLHSLDLSSSQDCLGYMLAAKSIERAADHAVSICKLVGQVKSWKIPPQVKSLTKKINEVFKDSINALLSLDAGKAHKTIMEAARLSDAMDGAATTLAYPSRLAIGNIKRIAEYAEDIAEAAVNMSARYSTVSHIAK